MIKHVLLLGRKGFVIEDVAAQLNTKQVELFAGTCLEDVIEIFSKHTVDIVIMGAGIDIDDRLTIIKAIFAMSDSTSVHMKDFESGQAGMLPFVDAILSGLTAD